MNVSNFIRTHTALMLLAFVSITAFGQQSHKVDFSDVDGFSGYVEFTTVRRGFAATLAGKDAKLVLKNYNCTSEEKEALQNAGIDFWGYSGYSPKTFGVEVLGQAYLIEERIKTNAISKNKLHLNNGLGDFTSVSFDEDTKKRAKEWQQKHNNKSEWEHFGGFNAETVTTLYLSDLKNEIDRILYEHKKEQEGKQKLEAEKKELNELLSETQKALWKGDLEKAKPLLEKAYKLDPTNETMKTLSQEYAKQKDEKAEEELDSKIAEGKRERESSSNSTQHTNNSYRYNNVSATQQKIATIDKAHNEFNNNIDKAFESQREQTRATQQASKDWWEQEKAAAAEEKAKWEQIAREIEQEKEDYKRHAEKMRSQTAQRIMENPNEYDHIGYFSEDGLALVFVGNTKVYNKYGFIDMTGKEIVPLKYDYAQPFTEGLGLIFLGDAKKLRGKWGFIDENGSEVIAPKYDKASSFSEGLAPVKLGYKWGYIDKKGKTVIPFDYSDASSFSEGLACVELNGKYGYIDKTGKEVIACKYDYSQLTSFSEGLACVKLNDKLGFIDKTGQEIIPIDLQYWFVGNFSEGMAYVKVNDKFGFIDKTGKELIPPKYDEAFSFSEGLARVKLNGKYGFINKTGQVVIPVALESVSDFSEGLARVKLNGKYGFINKTGNEVIPAKYEKTFSPFKNGKTIVKFNDRYFYIDKSGKEITE